MGIFSFMDPVLNSIFGPLLKLSPFWSIMIISFLVSLIIVVIYKFMTKQQLMKELKEEIKSFQKQMKELKGHPEKALAVQKKAMQVNMKYMMHSLRPTLVTFLPIILIFGWLNAHLAYMPILPGQEFSTTLELAKGTTGTIEAIMPNGIELTGDSIKEITDSQAIFTMKGDAGEYLLEFDINDQSFTKEVLITKEKSYAPLAQSFRNAPVKKITLSNAKTKVMNLGFMKLGWLGTYIIFSIFFSIILRRLMKVY